MTLSSTIEKTLMTGFLFASFWDRWVSSGLQKATLSDLRHRLYGLEDWIRILERHAQSYEMHADSILRRTSLMEAENYYRLAGLHYSIIQWMYPEAGEEKRKWYASCKEMHRIADLLTLDEILSVDVEVDGSDCYGRVRIPVNPKGCVIILKSLDCSKEEIVAYEQYFAGMDFVVVSFDGPGQGETYVRNKHRASRLRWNRFIIRVIDFAAAKYPELEIFLFGTGSGAAWALCGSVHPKVRKTAAVSPVFENETPMPDYSKERLSHISSEEVGCLNPELDDVEPRGSILLIHGDRDDRVNEETIQILLLKLPMDKHLIRYSDEGHCCYNRTFEILRSASDWFSK